MHLHSFVVDVFISLFAQKYGQHYIFVSFLISNQIHFCFCRVWNYCYFTFSNSIFDLFTHRDTSNLQMVFILCLVFGSLIKLCLDMKLLGFCLFLLSFLNLCVYNFCYIWEIFSHYFFKYIFRPTLFFCFNSANTNVRSFVIVSQVPEFYSLFNLFFPLLFKWDSF